MALKLIRYATDATISVYDADRWLGMIYCPINEPGGHADYIAFPSGGEKRDGIPNEQAAIHHLTEG